MPLLPSEVLALGLACAPQVAPSTLAAIAMAESGLDPLAIGVNGAPRPPPARTPDEAARTARALIAAGHDVDLGLAQINMRNLDRLGLDVRDAFDPCLNLRAAGRVLVEGYRRAAPAPGGEQQALRAALSAYNTGHPTRGLANGYVARVVAVRLDGVRSASPAGRPAASEPPRPFVVTVAAGGRP